jgi:hypothetical protein
MIRIDYMPAHGSGLQFFDDVSTVREPGSCLERVNRRGGPTSSSYVCARQRFQKGAEVVRIFVIHRKCLRDLLWREVTDAYRRAVQMAPRFVRAWFGLWRTTRAQLLRKSA